MKIVPAPQRIDYDFSEKLRDAKQMVSLFEAAIAAQELVADIDRYRHEREESEKALQSVEGQLSQRRGALAQAEKELRSLKEAHAEESRRHAALKQDYQEMLRRFDSIATTE
jgi:predicted  nucleic acid-binding Zn-ribbon protein